MIGASAETGMWREEQILPGVRRHQLPSHPHPWQSRAPSLREHPDVFLLPSCPRRPWQGLGDHAGREGDTEHKPTGKWISLIALLLNKLFLQFWQSLLKILFTVTSIYASGYNFQLTLQFSLSSCWIWSIWAFSGLFLAFITFFH